MTKTRIGKVTTKSGDKGSTKLATGRSLAKHHIFIRTLGSIDELNSNIGVLLSYDELSPYREFLADIQQSLFDLGALVAMQGEYVAPSPSELDEQISQLNTSLAPLTEFVLPGGTPACAHAHVCRAVCRRAELELWASVSDEPKLEPGAQYLNRLSDYFFVLARSLAQDEPQWRGPQQPASPT